jgi:hypothetical protein
MKTSTNKFAELKQDETEQSEQVIKFTKATRPTTAKGLANEMQKKTSMPPL